ncbi:MAG TPA: nucleoside 2-deoxyribosyltransferase [Thermoanaerobaculia bacterium]|nr:nucleoside 2-deoxyribosyltransferase [Thermoanaerobaculia bacterium]
MATTIYFSGAISGGRADVALYRRIVEMLESEGYRVLAGAVAAEHVGAAGETLHPPDICARDLGWLDQSDLVVAEVSVPSLGVGYEIAYATRNQIPVIALYRTAFTQRCSAMIAGDPGVHLIEYQDASAMLPALLESIRRLRR